MARFDLKALIAVVIAAVCVLLNIITLSTDYWVAAGVRTTGGEGREAGRGEGRAGVRVGRGGERAQRGWVGQGWVGWRGTEERMGGPWQEVCEAVEGEDGGRVRARTGAGGVSRGAGRGGRRSGVVTHTHTRTHTCIKSYKNIMMCACA